MRAFTVKIEKTENVSILKKLIKQAKANHLNHIDASDLDLFQVSLPPNGDVDAELQNLEPLYNLLPLSQSFSRVRKSTARHRSRAPTDVGWFGLYSKELTT